MGYIGSDPVRNDSVSTAQLADDAVTNPKIVDDITFTNVTASYFKGDGSAISGVTAEWDGTHTGNGVITGNFDISGNISGSATSTATFANYGGKISGSSTSTGSFGRLQLASGGGVDIPDQVKLNFGDGDDLKIYHSGAHSIIQDTGTGNLEIKGSVVKLRGTAGGDSMGVFTEDAGVELYYDNSKKLDVVTGGVEVTGNAIVSGTVSGSLGKFTSATISGGTITGITDLAVADGGTGASTLNDLITLSTHTTGNYVGTLTGGLGITSTGATSGEGIAHSISVDSAPVSGSWRGWASGSNPYFGGAIGIGITNPLDTLHIVGQDDEGALGSVDSNSVAIFQNNYNASDAVYATLIGGTTGYAGFHFGDKDDSDAGVLRYDLYAGDGYGGFQFHTEGSERMCILSDGKVGIGTATPSKELHVEGDALVTGMLTAREFHTQFVSASIIYQSGSTQFGDTTDDVHSFTGSLQVSGSSAPFHANMGGTTPSIGGGTVGVFQRSGVSGGGAEISIIGHSIGGSNLNFGTEADEDISYIEVDHSNSSRMIFHTNTSEALRLNGDNSATFAGSLTITNNSDSLVFSHNGTDAVFNTTDGAFSFKTTEGGGSANISTYVDIHGSGTGQSILRLYDQDDAEYGQFEAVNGTLKISTEGTSPSHLLLQPSSGNVGIGDATPLSLLDIGGATHNYGALSVNATGSRSIAMFQTGDTQTFTGTSLAHTAQGEAGIQIRNHQDTDNNFSYVSFMDAGGFTNSMIMSRNVDHDGSGGADLLFLVRSDDSGADTLDKIPLFLKNDGKVGIGTNNPGNYYFNDFVIKQAANLGMTLVCPSTTGQSTIAFADGTSGADRYDGSIEYNHSTRLMGLHAGGGVRQMTISGSGQVGIGTATPGQKLEIGSSNDTSVLRLKETTGQDSIWDLRAAANNSFHISGSTDGSTTTAMFTILDTGKVGIGTTNPGFDLDVQDATANLQVKSTTGANIAYANFCNTGGNVYVGQDNSGGGGLAVGSLAYAAIFGHVGAHPIQFITNETPRMTILHSSGNVGIGTNAPVTTLDVHSAGTEVASVWGMADDGTVWVATRTAETQNNYGAYAFMVGSVAVDGVGSPNTTAYIASKVLNSGGTLKGDLGFYTNAGDSLGTAKMLIDETGKIGIGTTAPAKTLTVEGDISGSAKLHVGPNPANQNGLSVTGNNQIGTFVSTDDHKVSIALGLPGDTQLFYLGSRASLAGTGTDHTVGLYADINGNGSVGLDFYTGGTATGNCRMAIAAGGNVGIGTTNPDRLLHLHTGTAGSITGNVNAPLVVETAGDANIQLLAPNTSDEYILFGSNSGNRTYIQVDLSATAANESFQIYTNSALAFKLDANSRISLSNNDGNTSNTVFGYKALTNNGTVLGDVGADNNTAIGHLAMGTGTTTTAIQNTAVGYDALTDLTTGNRNCAFGMNALMNLTSGQTEGNVAIGYGAADALETGDGNVVIGSAALDASHAATSNCVIIGARAGDAISATSADGTVAVGRSSLGALTIGAKNTALGYEALNAMQEGGGNVALGYQALKGANHADADNNIAIGSNTMDGIGGNGAAWNVGIGADALGGALTGDFNIAIGQAAGLTVAAGAKNVMIGHDAGATITTGDENVAIGEGAMNGGVVVGDQNVAIGANSGDALTSGTRNIFVGAGSGGSMAGGTDCVAIGHLALTGATSGYQDSCIAIGSYALRVQSGNVYAKNMAIGHGAMSGSTQMTNTVAIGYAALGNAVDGDYNVVLGNQAMGLGGGSKNPSHNVAIGYAAMKNYNQNGDGNNCVVGDEVAGSLTTGVNNTLIGTAANAHAAGGTNQTVIGKGAVGHADNIVVLGNTDVTGWHPADDNGVDLGSASYRFANLYVGDMQMNNEGTGGNEVDGTEGNWSLQEGEDDLFVINRKTGKKFKIKLEEM